MRDYSLRVNDLREVDEKLILKGIRHARLGGIISRAPLGCSGATVMLFGNDRKNEVSLRLYNSNVELLVTCDQGSFLFYGRFKNDIDDIILANRYALIVDMCRAQLKNEINPLNP